MDFFRRTLWGSSSSSDAAAADAKKEDGSSSEGENTTPSEAKEAEVEAPAAAPAEGSVGSVLWSVLSSKMGSDVVSSGISLPAWMYEPLTILQRSAECLEHSTLLDTASAQDDPATRLAYVTAFAITAYSSTNDARGKTNFNPILGETFEFVDKSSGLKFFAEQVSHHPPISALHVHGPNKKWQLWQNSSPATKFLGNSLDINTRGRTHVHFPRTKDHVNFTNPSTRVHNIILGRMWFEHFGELNLTLKDEHGTVVCTAQVNFKKAGMFQGAQHDVEGHVRLPNRDKVIKISGAWDSHVKLEWLVDATDGSAKKGEKREVFRVATGDEEGAAQRWVPPYGMSVFASQLSKSDAEMQRYLLPSDARRRPDRALLEKGDHESATQWKKRLEEQQRQERKARIKAHKEAKEKDDKKDKDDKDHDPYEPLWFRRVDMCSDEHKARWTVPANTHDEADLFVYCGDYWEQREQRLGALKDKTKSSGKSKSKDKGSKKGSAKTTPREEEVKEVKEESLEEFYYRDDKDEPLRPRAIKGSAADFMQHEIALTAKSKENEDSDEKTPSVSEEKEKKKDRDALKSSGSAQTLEVPKGSKGKGSKSKPSSHERKGSDQ